MLPLRSMLRVCLAITAGLLLASTASAQLSVAVEANPDPPKPGESVHVEVVVANAGPPAANLVAELDVPAQVDAFSQTLAGQGGVCTLSGNLNALCQTGEHVSWTLGSLGTGEIRRLKVAPRVAAAIANGTPIVFAARLEQGGGLVTNDAATVTVATAPVLDLDVDEDLDPAQAGAPLTYTLSYGNETALAATNVTLRFPLPPNTTFVSATGGGVFAAGAVEWALGTLGGGAGDARRVTVQVGGGVASGSTLRTTATIADTAVPTPHAASARAVTPVQASPVLGLAIEASPDPVKGNEGWLPQLTVVNRSAGLVGDVVLSLTIPDGVANFSTALFAGTPACPNAGATGFCEQSEQLVFPLGAIPAGATRTVQVPFVILAAVPDGVLVRLEAVVSATGGGEAAAQASALAQDAPVFDLAVDEDVDPVLPGGLVSYALSYGNESALAATNVALRFPVPAGTSFVSATGGGTLVNGVVEWALGTISAGDGDVRRVTVQVGAGLADGTLLRSTASISDAAAPTPRAARATVVTPVAASAPLEVVFTVGPDTVKGNESLSSKVVVANRGAALLDDVTLDLRIPEGVANFSTNLFAGTPVCPNAFSTGFCEPRERLVFALGAIPAGATRTIDVRYTVGAAVPDGSLVRLEAIATATDGGEAGAAATVLVKDAPVFDLAVDADADPAAPASLLTYVVTYGNESALAATNVGLRFPIPAGTSFVSATGGGALVGGNVEWALGTVAAGLGDTRRVVVQVGALPNGRLLRTTASIADAAAPTPHAARAHSVTPVGAAAPLALVIEANPDTVKSNEMLIGQLTVVNRGPALLDDVVVDVRLPDGIAIFSTALFGETTSCPNAGSTGFCEASERFLYTLEPLQPGESRMLQLPLSVSTVIPDGAALRLSARVTATDGGEAGATTSVLVHDTPVFDLALDEAADPVEPGSLLTYTLSYGNESALAATNVALRFLLPAGTSFVSASGGGAPSGDTVTWALGTVAANTGDTRRVTVQVGALPAGSLLVADASLGDAAAPTPRTARAHAVTAVQAEGPLLALVAQPGGPLALVLTATPTAVGVGGTSTIGLAVTNQSGGPLADVSVEARLPDRTGTLNQSLIPGTPTCPNAGSTGFCEARERIVFALGAMASGETRVVSFPAVVVAGTAVGSHLRIVAEANLPGTLGADARLAVRIGTPLDPDADGVESPLDNCPKVANPVQEDVGGVGIGAPRDGIGDACQCGDVNGDGRVTTGDVALMQRANLVPPTATLPFPNKCDVGGSAACNVSDVAIARRALLVPPTATIQQVCPADFP